MLTLLNRLYRKQLETAESIVALTQAQAEVIGRLKALSVGVQKLESLAVDNAAQQHTIAALTACTERLQREKETLLGAVSVEQLQAAYRGEEPVFAGSKPWPQESPRPANGHDRPLRRPAHELCGFSATHTKGVACQICEWRG